jgi:hypothetical protein
LSPITVLSSDDQQKYVSSEKKKRKEKGKKKGKKKEGKHTERNHTAIVLMYRGTNSVTIEKFWARSEPAG